MEHILYLLVIGIGMAGSHEAFFNPEFIMEYLYKGGDTVGGAGGIGDNTVSIAVIFFFVYTHNHGDIFTLGRGGNDHSLNTAAKVGGGFSGIGKQTGRFNHQIYSGGLPGDLHGVTFAENLDGFAVYYYRAVIRFNCAGIFAVG